MRLAVPLALGVLVFLLGGYVLLSPWIRAGEPQPSAMDTWYRAKAKAEKPAKEESSQDTPQPEAVQAPETPVQTPEIVPAPPFWALP